MWFSACQLKPNAMKDWTRLVPYPPWMAKTDLVGFLWLAQSYIYTESFTILMIWPLLFVSFNNSGLPITTKFYTAISMKIYLNAVMILIAFFFSHPLDTCVILSFSFFFIKLFFCFIGAWDYSTNSHQSSKQSLFTFMWYCYGFKLKGHAISLFCCLFESF